MIRIVYVLCALTSLLCAGLLLRGFARSKTRLLLWSGLCFIGLSLNNALLILDKASPQLDLAVARALPALIGMALLIFGLVWENR